MSVNVTINNTRFALGGGVCLHTLTKSDDCHVGRVFISALKCSICVWLQKCFAEKSGISQNAISHSFFNFEIGGTDTQRSIRHVMEIILSISLLSRVHGTSAYIGMLK